MIRQLAFFALLVPELVMAETLVATRTIRPGDVLTAGDVQPGAADVGGAAEVAADVVGLEAKVAIYAGRPVYVSDLGPPAVVERNEIIRLVFRQGALTITTEGRALDRAGVGETLRVMNIDSRTIVIAQIFEDGTAYVSN